MIRVPFTKYTSCGNNFVILDETPGAIAPEPALSTIAYTAVDGCFGVGADNFLVVQRSEPETLERIRASRGYWEHAPDARSAEYLFRMFEPDGSEALACGNGLLCIAQYLHEHVGIDATSIMTRLPMSEPAVVTLGVAGSSGRAWVNLGAPVRAPASMVDQGAVRRLDETIDVIEAIEVGFREYDLAPFFDRRSLSFKGYLTFTGEPHLVVFPEGILADVMFGAMDGTNEPENRRGFGTWLLARVGDYLNKRARDLFPESMNLNVARVRDPATIEYRTYERGVWRETLACGTGALGVANVARALGHVDSDSLVLYPHRCTWHDADAELRVRRAADGDWVLEGRPRSICEGIFKAPADARGDTGPADAETGLEPLSASNA